MRLSTLDLMPKIARARNFRKPFNANPRKTEHGAFGMMDGVFRHDGNSSHRRAHSNEFAPIYINRRVYGPDHARSLRSTRKRLDYSINGPLYCHRWMRPTSDRMEVWNRNWRPRDYIEVDPEIFLKEHKYPKDEVMMNPYLRYPMYHKLPLHYRLQMEEPIPVYDQVVNNKGMKVPERDGEYLFWEKWSRDPMRGRPGPGKQKALKNQVGGHIPEEQYMPNTGRMGSKIDGVKYKLIPVNRHTIPYEYPRGKLDTRFYHPLKRGRKENIPGQKDTSTEDNYPYDAMQELWGGVGVIRGHTFSSRMREYPEAKREFNQTWWPDRYYNFKERVRIYTEL